MPIMKWDPWRNLFPRVPIRQFLDISPWEPMSRFRGMGEEWLPRIDVFERKGDLIIKAEVPGVKPEDIKITLEGGVLTIQGERSHEEKVEEENYYHMERSYGSFQRSVMVPQGVTEKDVKADYEDGVLEVVVPEAAAVEAPTKEAIPVKVKTKKKPVTKKKPAPKKAKKAKAKKKPPAKKAKKSTKKK